MSYYGGTVTVAGRNLITSLMAGKTIEFTRIEVGSGAMPDGVEPIDMNALVAPVAEGVSTIPTVENGVLSMTVEYRNDLNGGLQEGFWLREFGVFAKTEDTDEILLYYATLGDSPQPVNAYKDNRIDIRRYPITIALELDCDVQVTYNPGSFITAAEAEKILTTLVQEAMSGVGTAIIKDITIPADGWNVQESDDQSRTDEYHYVLDLVVDEAKDEHFPSVALYKKSLETAKKAGLCPSAQALAGIVRFWAMKQPLNDMDATLALLSPGAGGTGGGGGDYVLPVATTTRLGGVKIGNGINVAEDGTISCAGGTGGDFATTEDTEKMLDEIFPPDES